MNRLKPLLPAGTPWGRTLFIMFFAQMGTAIGFSSVFPFLPLYVAELGSVSGLSVELLAGLVFSVQAATMMIASPIWGALADRYGRKLMVERAMFGGAVLLLLMAFVRSAEELVLLRAIQGLITGTLSASNALVAAVVPRERTGFAMGLLQVGLGTGVAMGPLLGGVVADAHGYRAAFYVTAALLLLAGILVLVGVHEEFSAEQADGLGLWQSFRYTWRDILGRKGVSIAYLMQFMSQLGRMMLVPLIPFLVAELMVDSARLNTFTGLLVGAGSATTTISAVYLGRLGDRVGHRIVLVVCSGAAAVLYLPQSAVTRGWQLLLLMALVGVAMGGVLPSIAALLARYNRPGDEGSVYGLDNSVRAAGRALAPLLGSLIALILGLRAAFLGAGVVMATAAALGFWRLPASAHSSGRQG